MRITNMKGIDFGYGKIPAKMIKDAGYKFVCRYLSYSPGKNINKSEYQELKDTHLNVVLVWETLARRCLGGFQAGVLDAQEAKKQADLIGNWKVIYFACDDDFTEAQLKQIVDYFKGIASILDKDQIGVYGGYDEVKCILDASLASYAWQTYAWSHGKWDDRAQLHQTNIYGPKLAGVDCDIDEAVADDFGQF